MKSEKNSNTDLQDTTDKLLKLAKDENIDNCLIIYSKNGSEFIAFNNNFYESAKLLNKCVKNFKDLIHEELNNII